MKKNILRDGGRSIPRFCKFRYTTTLFRPAVVHQRVRLLVTELPKLEEGPLGCIVIKKVRFSSPNLVMGFVNHQIW